MARKRTVVMISGRGSNMAALVEAASESQFPAEIVGVISDNPEAAGLAYAAQKGVETRAVARADHPGKAAHEAAIETALSELGAEIVCLAGYMRLLSPGFVERWQGRMINVHPSLLPAFKGLDTHKRALEAGLRIHGCTVHFVTSAMDDGPIVSQAAVAVGSEDDETALAARVLRAEHQIYPLALKLLAEGRVSMVDGRAVFRDIAERRSGSVLASPDIDTDAVDLESLARITP